MEKYIVDVYKDDRTRPTSWFSNFMSSVNYSSKFNDILSQYNARDVPDSNYIEFETEEDFLIFKLKFM